jgi:uncharacterized protein
LQWVRREVAPLKLILRTNFAVPLNADLFRAIALAFDQVVASVDGTPETHDRRRGAGSYAATLKNLQAYVQVTMGILEVGELSLATVMGACDLAGSAGDSVRALARRLGVRRTRFRPLLPLGRAADWDEPATSEALGSHADPMDLIEGGFQPVASCGLGQNLYVEPSGQSFPCYAYHQPHNYLGNVIADSLKSVINREPFGGLCRHRVDTNPKCRQCDVRYLCGGACRAWGTAVAQDDLDAPPPQCDGLKVRADGLLREARTYLNLT